MASGIDEFVNAIISQNPKVSREAILKRLEEERKKSGGLISDEVLLRIIAAEFGVKLANSFREPFLVISSLVAGLNDVSVAGRVIAVYPSKASGKTAHSKFASVLIADKSGAVRVVLWNDKAELVNSEKVKAGHVVKFIHGYTMEGRFGHIELHIGEKGEVQVLEGEEAEGYPLIMELTTKIKEITNIIKKRRVNLAGKVKGILRESTFQRKDSTAGKIMCFLLVDETGEIPVVVWNEKVDEAKKIIKDGIMLQVVNAKVKRNLDGRIEIHADRETYMNVLTPSAKEKFRKIVELKEEMKNVSVQGVVATKPLTREVKTARGETVKLAVFEIKDETGSIWVSAWRKNAEKTANLRIGEKIAIKNAHVKRGFADQLEIATKNETVVELLS
ncbi:MAG: OB-fold nucleic acid binding domain-containing protein [Candidatus Bathyarchaeia archaeon]